jgi:hypothetical protein
LKSPDLIVQLDPRLVKELAYTMIMIVMIKALLSADGR